MQVQTWSTAQSAAPIASQRLAAYRATLWLALLTYPLVPGLFFRSHNLSSVNPVLAVAAFALSYAWAVTGPVMAWFLLGEADRIRLNRPEHPQVIREAVLAAIGAPFFVFTGAALVWVHLARFQIAVWYLLLAAVAAARWLPADQAVPVARPVIERVHRASAIILLAFGIAHVANHTAALDSLAAHVTVQNFLRTVYRQPPLEILLVIAFFLHAASAGRWGLAPAIGESAALKFCYGVIAVGTLVTLLLLLPLSGIRFA